MTAPRRLRWRSEAFALTAPRRPVSFGRPLGQCCRYCRQHCTGLALRTPDRLCAASVKPAPHARSLEGLFSPSSSWACDAPRNPPSATRSSTLPAPRERGHQCALQCANGQGARSARTLRAERVPAAQESRAVARMAAAHGAERAGWVAAEREPSAMLPAVSAALAEWSRGGAARFASTRRAEPPSLRARSPRGEHSPRGANDHPGDTF